MNQIIKPKKTFIKYPKNYVFLVIAFTLLSSKVIIAQRLDQTPPKTPYLTQVKVDHHCTRHHLHQKNKQTARKNKQAKAKAIQPLNTHALPAVNRRFRISCPYTIDQIATLNTPDLINFLTTNFDYDCVIRPFFNADGYLAAIFSNAKMQAVFEEISNRAAAYDGTYNSGIFGLLGYMHAAIYHEFYSSVVSLNPDSKAKYSKALEDLSTNNHLFDLTKPALDILSEYMINLDYKGVRHQAFAINVLKQGMRNLAVNDNWKLLPNSNLDRAYAIAYNSIFFLIFRGTIQDDDFKSFLPTDSEFTSLLASVGKDAELASHATFGVLVNNAVQELARMASVTGVITNIEADLAAIINLYPRFNIKWLRAMVALNEHGNCATYNLCQSTSELEKELETYLFPNTYSFDDGKLILKTQLSFPKAQQLYYAAKEVQAQFFKMLQTDQPVAGDENETLNMVIFGSKSQYDDYAPYLYNISTDNGGIYIERRATFYTWDRTVGVESSLSLESLFRHEYCHYLQGRYLIPGFWGEVAFYNNSRMVWYEEGMAEFFAGSTPNEGIKLLASNVGVVKNNTNNWPTLETVFNSSYSSGNFNHYYYGNMLWYYFYHNDFGKLKQFFDLTRNNDIPGFDNLVNTLKTSEQTAYQAFLSEVNNGTIGGKEPIGLWIENTELQVGSTVDIALEFTKVTGLTNTRITETYNLMNKRFKITGQIIGQGNASDNATAAKSTGEALNSLLTNLKQKTVINNLKYCVGYLTNVTFEGGVPQADFVITGPLINTEFDQGLVADFRSNIQEVTAGKPVNFIPKIQGYHTSINWTFEGGTPTTSSQENPSVVYSAPGLYKVTLRIQDREGKVSTKVKQQYIKVYANQVDSLCKASMEYDYTFIKKVQIGDYINETTGFPPNGYSDFSAGIVKIVKGQTNHLKVYPDYTNSDQISVSAWIDWNQDGDFDDAGEQVLQQKGRFESAQTIIAIPANVVTNQAMAMRIRLGYFKDLVPCGLDNYMGEIEDYSIVVTNTPEVSLQSPTAVFIANTNHITEGQQIAFENKSTGSPTSIHWEFIGGSPTASTSNTPIITYNKSGVYPVILTVTNAKGTNQSLSYVTVKKTGGVEGNYCTTTNTSSSVHITNVTLGSINNTTGFGTNGYTSYIGQSSIMAKNSDQTLSVSASQAWGPNQIKVWIDWNQDGDFDDANEMVMYVTGGNTPYTVNFTVPANAKEGGTRMRVRLAYSVTPKPCGTDGTGETEDYTVFVGSKTLYAGFTASKQVIEAGESTTFSPIALGGASNQTWTFEGGNPTTSTSTNPTITYNTGGTYKVSLTVANANDAENNTVTDFITVNDQGFPKADFTASATTVKVGESITFTNISAHHTSFVWNFSGLATPVSTEANPVVSWDTVGEYVVQLVATNSNGTHVKSIKVKVERIPTPPIADFSTSATTINTGESITFTDVSQNTPTAWNWTFEGGNPATSTEQNPMVNYVSAGTYNVTLQVTNDDGSNTKSISITVNSQVTSVNNNEGDYQLNVHPNPVVDGEFRFVLPTNAFKTKKIQIDILDLQGKLIKTTHTQATSGTVKLVGIAKGVYLVRFYTKNNTLKRRIILK